MNNIFATHDMHGTSLHEIVQVNPACFYARALAYLPYVPPTEAELAVIAKYEEQCAAYDAWCVEQGCEEPPPACFTTASAAKRYLEVHMHMNNVDDDLRAFHAPSECYVDAYRGISEELEQLEAEFGTSMPLQNPLAQRCHTEPVPESVHECEYGDEEYQWRLRQAGL